MQQNGQLQADPDVLHMKHLQQIQYRLLCVDVTERLSSHRKSSTAHAWLLLLTLRGFVNVPSMSNSAISLFLRLIRKMTLFSHRTDRGFIIVHYSKKRILVDI